MTQAQTTDLERFRPLLDALTVPASLHTPDGSFVHVNVGAERASGLPNAQLVGRHVTDLVSPEDRKRVERQFRRAVETGTPTDFGTVFVDAAGNQRATRAQQLPLTEGDRVVGVLILAWQALLPAPTASSKWDEQLTPRQLEVLQLLATGMSTLQIAAVLGLTRQTVRNHVRDVLAHLDAHNRVEAVAKAQHAGLLAPRPLDARPARLPGRGPGEEAEPAG
jgi:PAS domain S-box-containing protein